jgi:general secretion pathway protein N
LAGEAKCENGILVLPLTGQSGMESLTIRIRRNGQYEARLAVRADTPEMSQALAAAGFAPGEGGFGMTLTGRL